MNRTILPGMLMLVFFGLPGGQVQAGKAGASAGWMPAGFGGSGNFLGIHYDKTIPGVVYARSDVSGLFLSTDNGEHWRMLNTGLGNLEISSFAVDPFDSNTLYAGAGALRESSKAGMYVSHDGGQNWRHLEATLTNQITFRKYRTSDCIAPDPEHKGTVLSGSHTNGIWLTRDGGLSWEQVYQAAMTKTPYFYDDGSVEDDPAPVNGQHPAPVSVIVFDPSDAGTVYAGLGGAGVIKSQQGGQSRSWKPVNKGLPAKAMVADLAIGPRNCLYAALGKKGVYKSTNGGKTWKKKNKGLPLQGNFVSSVAVHPTNANTAYLILSTYDYPNLWKTSDGGSSWLPLGNISRDEVNNPGYVYGSGITMSWQVRLAPWAPETLFYVNYLDIMRSTDAGAHIQEMIVGAQNTCVNTLTLDSDHPAGEPDTLYATHWDAGLLKSTDQGVTWAAVLPGRGTHWDQPTVGHYWNFAISGSGAAKYYFTTCDGHNYDFSLILRSTDGLNWTEVFRSARPCGVNWRGYMKGLAVDPVNPSTVYASQDCGNIYKSTDSGMTWEPTVSQPDATEWTGALAVDQQGQVFAGSKDNGLWRSTDGGISWDRWTTDLPASIYSILATGASVYVATDDPNLYRSTDGGKTWQNLTNLGPAEDGDGVSDHGLAIAEDPTDPEHILFGRMDTWHCADAGSGVLESKDGGTTWDYINAGLGNTKVSALIMGSDGALYAGTNCGGTWRR